MISRSGKVLYAEERNLYRSVQGRQAAQFLRRKKEEKKEMGKKVDSFTKEPVSGHKAHEKILSIINHEGNENSNPSEIPQHTD